MNITSLESRIAPLPSMDESTRGEYVLKDRVTTDDWTMKNQIHRDDLLRAKIQPLRMNQPSIQDSKIDRLPKKGLLKPSASPSTNKGTPNSVTMYPSVDGNEDKQIDAAPSRNRQRPTTRNSSCHAFLPPLPKTKTDTKAIPIASNSMKRTASELQLMEDEAMADYRDYCMYTRIVNGMTERRSWTELPSQDGAIRNIIRTRHLPVVDDHDGGERLGCPTSTGDSRSHCLSDGRLQRHSFTTPAQKGKQQYPQTKANGKHAITSLIVSKATYRDFEDTDGGFLPETTSIQGLLLPSNPTAYTMNPTDALLGAANGDDDEGVFQMDDF